MHILIVDDDHDSTRLLCNYLKPFGSCEIAVDGNDAIESVRIALEENDPFNLICLDILMPTLDGHAALKKIRQLEERNGVHYGRGAKIVMTSILSDNDNILKSFLRHCDAYIIKPVAKQDLLGKLQELRMIGQAA